MTEPNRRQFLALAAALAGSPILSAPRGKTLAQYKAEANAYAAALTTLSSASSSMAIYRSASERVGANLKHRFSWLVAQVAQDPRLIDALKPHFESPGAFNRFAAALAGDATAIMNLPGLRQALAEAIAKDTQQRKALASAVKTFIARIGSETALLKPTASPWTAREAEIEGTLARIEAEREAAAWQFGVACAVAALTIIGAGIGGGAGATAVMASAGASPQMTSLALAAAAARIPASAVTAAAEKIAAHVPSSDPLVTCVQAAEGKRRACLSAISGTPAEREGHAAMCEASYLAESAACSITR
jgi:hypothetical protein